MTINATEGDAAANSYGDEDEALAFFEGRLNDDGYINATKEVREQALRTSTLFLDSRIDWIGDIKDQATPQALAWPRVFDVTLDTPEDILVLGQAIPQDLKNAQFELSLYLINNGEPNTSNDLDSIKVGSLNIDFNEFKRSQLIPDTVWPMISYLGSRVTPGPRLRTVSLCR